MGVAHKRSYQVGVLDYDITLCDVRYINDVSYQCNATTSNNVNVMLSSLYYVTVTLFCVRYNKIGNSEVVSCYFHQVIRPSKMLCPVEPMFM